MSSETKSKVCFVCAKTTCAKVLKDAEFKSYMDTYWLIIFASDFQKLYQALSKESRCPDLCEACVLMVEEVNVQERLLQRVKRDLDKLTSGMAIKTIAGIERRQRKKIEITHVHIQILQKYPNTSIIMKKYHRENEEFVDVNNEVYRIYDVDDPNVVKKDIKEEKSELEIKQENKSELEIKQEKVDNDNDITEVKKIKKRKKHFPVITIEDDDKLPEDIIIIPSTKIKRSSSLDDLERESKHVKMDTIVVKAVIMSTTNSEVVTVPDSKDCLQASSKADSDAVTRIKLRKKKKMPLLANKIRKKRISKFATSESK